MTLQDQAGAGENGGILLASDHAYAVLRRDILMGVFAPGSNLRFAELRTRYDIGASPLREALFRLASQKLVLQESNRGFRVPPLDPADWADIVAMRRRLEPGAAEASVTRGDEGWEEALLLAHRRLKRLGSAAEIVTPLGDSDRSGKWEQCHRDFHFSLIAACGSDWTIHFCTLLIDQFDRYRRFAIPARSMQSRLALQHDALLIAALDRDAVACRDLLAVHVTDTGEAVADALTRLT
ncbi:GntR family transcriptional regulator [Roseisalinus antarcticus]|uniref:HTH-type transcriptional repressor CsiR n=1 Tax=Roseisalinus antarcticus TaxID=254357 RepID=A0A1Y5SM88_9RHOB|nr:GntR family transcriptional regulator [Roseisalinus antarcticus]SLN42305.1 HTH-type transcriptional repressor CsiR [Roseisalinus antarcticus]